jgi:hypothetical protein
VDLSRKGVSRENAEWAEPAGQRARRAATGIRTTCIQ